MNVVKNIVGRNTANKTNRLLKTHQADVVEIPVGGKRELGEADRGGTLPDTRN